MFAYMTNKCHTNLQATVSLSANVGGPVGIADLHKRLTKVALKLSTD